jgi:hypothetical protein
LYVHLRTISCRCHRSNGAGVTLVAISRNVRRPTRMARAASRCRSSSVKRRRRPPSFRRRTRFSSDQVRDRVPLPALQPASRGTLPAHKPLQTARDDATRLALRRSSSVPSHSPPNWLENGSSLHFDVRLGVDYRDPL